MFYNKAHKCQGCWNSVCKKILLSIYLNKNIPLNNWPNWKKFSIEQTLSSGLQRHLDCLHCRRGPRFKSWREQVSYSIFIIWYFHNLNFDAEIFDKSHSGWIETSRGNGSAEFTGSNSNSIKWWMPIIINIWTLRNLITNTQINTKMQWLKSLPLFMGLKIWK